MSIDLTVAGRSVATYVVEPDVPPTLSPRPYFHPIRTLSGVVVTDVMPQDHRWHLGLSLAVQDVNRHNLWGGRTYVRDQDYVWLDDHGTITHEGFERRAADRFAQRLSWRGHDGDVLLRERRVVTASPVDKHAWALDLAWHLSADDRVTLGSPVTNGWTGGAGYGGCFLRIAPTAADAPAPEVAAGSLRGEDEVSGSTAPEVVWDGHDYTLTCSGLGDGDRWFVRTTGYPGICAAWALDRVRVIEPGTTWSGRFRVVVADRE